MKLNLGGLKGFFVNHGEKIGVAFIGMMALWMVYSGLTTERLDDNKHQQLKDAARAARENIEQTTKVKLAPAPTIGKMRSLDAGPWATPTPYNNPIWPPNTKRADPEIFAAHDLEVTTGFDAVAWSDPRALRNANKPEEGRRLAALREEEKNAESGARQAARLNGQGGVIVSQDSVVEGVSWVAVMALVPFQEQRNAYEKALANSESYDPMSDVPAYFGFLIQRADVTDGGEPKWQNLPGVQQKSLDRLHERFPTAGSGLPPVAHIGWTHPILTGWLLPLVNRDFGDEARHSVIPNMPTSEELAAEEAKNIPDEVDDPEAPTDGGFGKVEDRGDGNFARGGRGGRGVQGRGGREAGMMRGGGGDEGMMGGRMGGGMMGGSRGGRGRNIGSSMVQADNKEFLMLRFFDLQATPGRRYQYRVRVALYDPNRNFPARMLTREAAEKNANRKAYRVAEWSEPSPIARVPYPGEMLAGKATAASGRFNSEPKVTMVIKTFDNRVKAEAAIEKLDLYRGSVGNVAASTKEKIKLLESRKGTIVPHDDYRLWTGMTLVEIAGGRKLVAGNDDFLEPAKILVLTRNGKLVVKSQIEDENAYKNFQAIYQSEEGDEAMGGPRGPRGGGAGLGGGGEFEFE